MTASSFTGDTTIAADQMENLFAMIYKQPGQTLTRNVRITSQIKSFLETHTLEEVKETAHPSLLRLKQEYDDMRGTYSPDDLVVDHVISNRVFLAVLKGFKNPKIQLKHWEGYHKSINDFWNFTIVCLDYNSAKSQVEKMALDAIRKRTCDLVPMQLMKIWNEVLSSHPHVFAGNNFIRKAINYLFKTMNLQSIEWQEHVPNLCLNKRCLCWTIRAHASTKFGKVKSLLNDDTRILVEYKTKQVTNKRGHSRSVISIVAVALKPLLLVVEATKSESSPERTIEELDQ